MTAYTCPQGCTSRAPRLELLGRNSLERPALCLCNDTTAQACSPMVSLAADFLLPKREWEKKKWVIVFMQLV